MAVGLLQTIAKKIFISAGRICMVGEYEMGNPIKQNNKIETKWYFTIHTFNMFKLSQFTSLPPTNWLFTL